MTINLVQQNHYQLNSFSTIHFLYKEIIFCRLFK